MASYMLPKPELDCKSNARRETWELHLNFGPDVLGDCVNRLSVALIDRSTQYTSVSRSKEILLCLLESYVKLH